MRRTSGVLGVIWRSAVIGAGYVISVIVFAILASIAGVEIAAPPGSESILLWTFLSGFLLSIVLGPLASRMVASRWRQLTVWLSILFFNMGSVVIEGAIFAPELVPMPLSILMGQQLLASAVVALLVTLLFATPARSAPIRSILKLRRWQDWTWRFVGSSVTYLAAYFVFGWLSYSLVTRGYYEAQIGGLTTPDLKVVLAVETFRSLLIVLSAALFVFSYAASAWRRALTTGFILFWVGGLAPLIVQVTTLPPGFLVASAVEILLQNVLTGTVASLLLMPPREQESRPG